MHDENRSNAAGESVAHAVAKGLLDIGAIFLRPDEPFIWASGIKSPIYCDNRLTLTAPSVRNIIESAIADTVRDEFDGCQVLMGTSTAGIPHAAIAGHILGMPMGYVRGSAKDHGRNNKIEGRLEPGARTVVIEDLISTGQSSMETVHALQDAGAQVMGIVSIFTYGMGSARSTFEDESIKVVSLTDFDTIIDVAAADGRIREDDRERLLRFREDPRDDAWMREDGER